MQLLLELLEMLQSGIWCAVCMKKYHVLLISVWVKFYIYSAFMVLWLGGSSGYQAVPWVDDQVLELLHKIFSGRTVHNTEEASLINKAYYY